jgi:hypothetical protein
MTGGGSCELVAGHVTETGDWWRVMLLVAGQVSGGRSGDR